MRRRTAVWSLVGTATLAALFVAAWRSSDLGRASADLERQRTAARRAGVPIDWDDLRRLQPPVPDADNAAVLYKEGFAEIRASKGFEGLTDRLLDAAIAGNVKPKDLARAEATLDADAKGLTLIEAGTHRRGLDFDRPWEQGARLLFPELSDEHGAGRAFVLRAVLAQDPVTAGRDLRIAARLAADAGSEPVLISPLVEASSEITVEKGIRAVGGRGAAWADAARSALDAFGPLPDGHRFLAGESVMGRHVVEDLAQMDLREIGMIGTNGEGEPALPTIVRFAKIRPVRDAFEARAIEYWRKVYAALPADPLDWRRLGDAAQIPYPEGPSGALVTMASPLLTGVADLAARIEAERRLTRAALDRERGGNALLPQDPFGNGPIKARHDAKGWTLWSVGPDGTDQGGKPRTNYGDTAYDLVVTVPQAHAGP